MKPHIKRYFWEFGLSMTAYSAMVPASIWMLGECGDSSLRYGIAALPIFPAAFAVWAVIRCFRGLDELQRRIHSEAITFSFLATCLLTLSWGFLQNAGLPHADVVWVAPMLIVLWGLGVGMASRRYA